MRHTAEDKRKHLEMLQGVINRMASNSFLFKGWSITIIVGVSAFATKEMSLALMIIPIASTLLFWGIDAYYLGQERLYRNLYNDVATRTPSAIDYGMKTEVLSLKGWLVAAKRPILLGFYGTVLLMLVGLLFALGIFSVSAEVTVNAA